MLSQKNPDISKAYDLLQIISKDKKARMLYEAREAEIRDQLTRVETALNKGRAEGKAQRDTEIVLSMLQKGMSLDSIADITKLPIDQIEEIRETIKAKIS